MSRGHVLWHCGVFAASEAALMGGDSDPSSEDLDGFSTDDVAAISVAALAGLSTDNVASLDTAQVAVAAGAAQPVTVAPRFTG